MTEAPAIPTTPHVTKNAPTGVTLEWTASPEDTDTPLDGFNVLVREKGSQRWRKVNREVSKEPSFVVTGLTRGTEYEVQVTAVNKAGESKPSPSSDTFKLGDVIAPKVEEKPKEKEKSPVVEEEIVPETEVKSGEKEREPSEDGRRTTGAPSSPENFHVASASPDAVVLAWEAPEEGAPVKKYKLEKKKSTRKVYENVAETTDLEYAVKNLEADTPYDFKLTAINPEGASEPVEITDVVPKKGSGNLPYLPK